MDFTAEFCYATANKANAIFCVEAIKASNRKRKRVNYICLEIGNWGEKKKSHHKRGNR